MTHSLFRQHPTPTTHSDIVVIAKAAKGVNESNAKTKLHTFIEDAIAFGALNVGHGRGGNYRQTEKSRLKETVKPLSTITAVFDNQHKFMLFFKHLIHIDLGLSITLGGTHQFVHTCCRQQNITPHSQRQSIGVFGNQKKHVSPPVQEITTMCGHGLIAEQLIHASIEDIKQGKTTAEDVAETLEKICLCGIFNASRCREILDVHTTKP
jgi:hypothetical protein